MNPPQVDFFTPPLLLINLLDTVVRLKTLLAQPDVDYH